MIQRLLTIAVVLTALNIAVLVVVLLGDTSIRMELSRASKLPLMVLAFAWMVLPFVVYAVLLHILPRIHRHAVVATAALLGAAVLLGSTLYFYRDLALYAFVPGAGVAAPGRDLFFRLPLFQLTLVLALCVLGGLTAFISRAAARRRRNQVAGQ